MKILPKLGYDLANLGTYFLAQKTWVPQRRYVWQLIMPHTISGVAGYLVSQFCQDIRFGDYSIAEVSKLKYGAYQRFYAGLQEIGSVHMMFLVTVDNSVYSYFYGWYGLIIDEQGYYHPKSVYKKDIYIALYDRSGIPSTTFKLKGAFPKTKPVLDLSYSANDILMLPVDLSIDGVEISSFIGSIRKGVENFASDVARKAKNLLGDNIK